MQAMAHPAGFRVTHSNGWLLKSSPMECTEYDPIWRIMRDRYATGEGPLQQGTVRMSIPLRQAIKIGAYLFKQKLAGRDKFPITLELEPLFACNLACEGCGKIQ